MEGMFRQYGIWNPKGQQYTPQDKDQLMFYKESVDGQILQEGINEPGAMADWIAAATSYANSDFAMIPFYIYLFYVWFPTYRRLGMGCRRYARARLPGWAVLPVVRR